MTPPTPTEVRAAREAAGLTQTAANQILEMATLESMLIVAAALPGSVRDIETRTGIPKTTVARAIADLQCQPPQGLGIVLDATGAISDWGIINKNRLTGLENK